MLDSRPTDQHIGVNKSGSVTRFGTLPAAISVPGRWLTVNDKGIFRSNSVLAKIYAAQKAANKGKSIVFCNTGHWASLGWFIDSELLGNKQSKMYDGSMAQWSRLATPAHPNVSEAEYAISLSLVGRFNIDTFSAALKIIKKTLSRCRAWQLGYGQSGSIVTDPQFL